MRYAFFMGCTVPIRVQNYELATRRLSEKLGIELVDLDFTCCGAPVEPLKRETALVMAARNLAIAEEKGLNIVTVCNSCTKSLTKFNKVLQNDEKTLARVNHHLKALGLNYGGGVSVKHFARMLYEDFGVKNIERRVVSSLRGLAVAVHYGCHYYRPSEVYDNFDDPENPKSLDELIEATGARSLDYENKGLCCGGTILALFDETALAMSGEKLKSAVAAGADALVVVCPFCGIMFDTCQREVEDVFLERYRLPVIYYPQLLGLSLGLGEDELGFEMNLFDVGKLLGKICS